MPDLMSGQLASEGVAFLPGHVDEPGQPPDFGPAHVGVGVDRAVLVVVVEPEQLAVVEPVFLPGSRRVSQLTLRLCLHRVLPPLRARPGGFLQALINAIVWPGSPLWSVGVVCVSLDGSLRLAVRMAGPITRRKPVNTPSSRLTRIGPYAIGY